MEHAEGGVHGGHGGHQDINAWQAPPEAEGDVKVEGKHANVKNKIIDLQTEKDTIETPENDSTEVQQRDMDRKASGFGYSTLSQNELDHVQSGDPILLGHKGQIRNAPPHGSGGTGNPFFAPNPMVTFFVMFNKIEQNMKYLELVASKLAVQDIKSTKEAGLYQAQATLNAGEAAYKSEMAQAVTSFVQAGIGLAQTAMSGFAMLKAFKAVDHQTQEAQAESERAGELKKTGETSNKSQMENLEKGLNSKRAFMKTRPGGGESEEVNIQKNGDAADTQLQSDEKKAAKHEVSVEVAEQETAETKALQNKGKKEWDDFYAEGKEKGIKDKDKLEEYADNQMNDSIAKDQTKFNKLKYKNTKLNTNFEAAQGKAASMTTGRMKHVGEMMQSDPSYQIFQAASGGINQGLTGLQHYFKGMGDLQQAYWNAQAQKFGMYMQIDSKGLDSAMQMFNDAYQQANDITQTLTKMSDQEQSSFRWSA